MEVPFIRTPSLAVNRSQPSSPKVLKGHLLADDWRAKGSRTSSFSLGQVLTGSWVQCLLTTVLAISFYGFQQTDRPHLPLPGAGNPGSF